MSAWETTAVECGLLFLAGALRGFTGFGFSLAAVPLLSLIVVPARAVPVVLILQFLVSVAGLRDAVRHCDWGGIRLLAVGAAIATPFGAWGLAHLAAAPVRLVIAAVVACGAFVLVGGVRLAAVPRGWHVVPFGLVCGLFNGLAGIPGPPIIAFYLASPVSSRVARASMIVFFLATSVLALVPLAWLGLLSGAILLEAVIGFPRCCSGHGSAPRPTARAPNCITAASRSPCCWPLRCYPPGAPSPPTWRRAGAAAPKAFARGDAAGRVLR